jgi:hypothetical protein
MFGDGNMGNAPLPAASDGTLRFVAECSTVAAVPQGGG